MRELPLAKFKFSSFSFSKLQVPHLLQLLVLLFFSQRLIEEGLFIWTRNISLGVMREMW